MSFNVTIPADVQQIDQTGWVWTFLDEAAEPSRVVVDAVIVAGDSEDPFLARVIDIVDGSSGRKIVHLDVLGIPEQIVEELRHANVITA